LCKSPGAAKQLRGIYSGTHQRSVFFSAEQNGQAPNARKAHQRENDAGKDGDLAAKQEGNDVKIENANASPVQRADNHKRQSNFVQYHTEPPGNKMCGIYGFSISQNSCFIPDESNISCCEAIFCVKLKIICFFG
jgi:hypothetical protein